MIKFSTTEWLHTDTGNKNVQQQSSSPQQPLGGNHQMAAQGAFPYHPSNQLQTPQQHIVTQQQLSQDELYFEELFSTSELILFLCMFFIIILFIYLIVWELI